MQILQSFQDTREPDIIELFLTGRIIHWYLTVFVGLPFDYKIGNISVWLLLTLNEMAESPWFRKEK